MQLDRILIAFVLSFISIPVFAVEGADAKTYLLTDAKKETVMTLQRAAGSFDVKLTPQAAELNAKADAPGRMTIAKQFYGDLDATSEGQMLAAQSSVKGSAGYVAMERVTGSLQGKRGSFVLQHTGTMNRGAPTLSITVVPDSGTDELIGLSGSMNITIADGKHSYVFDYSIAPKE